MSVSDHVTDETELIQTYLAPLAMNAPGAFGLQDDVALIKLEPGFNLVVSTDPVIAGVHFFSNDAPHDIAWKALAVNVSDLAAKGAEPFAYTMALAFPEAPRRDWMAAFCAGLRQAQTAFGCTLVGGDTDRTPGPLSIGITAFGKIQEGRLVRRNGARIGDHVFVTGTIGDSALGLHLRQTPDAIILDDEHRRFLLSRYLRPLPRLVMVQLLQSFASAALDVSDGFLKDAARIASGAGAALSINEAAVPLSAAAKAALTGDASWLKVIVSGGDDYEILCAVPASKCAEFRQAAAALATEVSQIGVLAAGSGVCLFLADGRPLIMTDGGFDHFAQR